jgi:hypothetical protein
MKKTVILLVFAFSFSGIFAQELVSKKGEEFLPKKDDWAISMCADPIFSFIGNMFNANPANGTPTASWMNTNQTIVAKKFMEDNQAYRVILRLGYVNSSFKNLVDNDGDTTTAIFPALPLQVEDGYKLSNTNIGIGVGKEFRKGKNRLQGFYGADIMIWISSTKQSYTYGNLMSSKDTIIGGIQNVTDPTSTSWTTGGTVIGTPASTSRVLSSKTGMTFGVGVRGFIGAEYFIFPKIAIGAEYGWGLGFQSTGSGTTVTEKQGLVNGVNTVGEQTFETAGSSIFGVDTDLNQGNVFGFKGSNAGTASLRLTLHF